MRSSHLSVPPKQRLVLLGGGHAHVQVLRALAMGAFPETEVILISRDVHTPYSGMLPGYMAGHYDYDDIHIDLSKLARRAHCQLIVDSASGIDPEAKLVHIPNRPPIRYDWLSINIGSTPRVDVPGAERYALAVKPIDQFLVQLQAHITQLTLQDTQAPIAVVGGGAAGVEVAMALRYRLNSMGYTTPIVLIASSGILPTMPKAVQDKAKEALSDHYIEVIESRVAHVQKAHLAFPDRESLAVAFAVWTTGAMAKSWLSDTGLSVTDSGFVAVSDTLQSVSHPTVFAVGDVATVVNQPRPKAGVFAVRQGKMLVENLQRSLIGKVPKSFTLQTQFLSLIALGDKRALGSRGEHVFEGKWVWQWKNYIDQKFMRRFRVDPMPITSSEDVSAMRCTGCGGKVGGEVLRNALALSADLPDQHRNAEHIALADAAVSWHGDQLYLQSTDTFVDCIFDDYRLGQLIAIHASNDLLASGVIPDSALATVGIPPAGEQLQADCLKQIHSGMLSVLSEWHCPIKGGHTFETDKLQVGLTVTSVVPGGHSLWAKSGAKIGDKLCLTHSVGGGIILGGYQSYRTQGRWLQSWLDAVLVPRASLMVELEKSTINAATDISGFGLIGHLKEICDSSEVSAVLEYSKIPLFSGAETLASEGVQSSIMPANVAYAPAMLTGFTTDERIIAERVLYDPQTAGGLLLSVAPDEARRLEAQGAVSIIGEIEAEKSSTHHKINICK